MPSSFLVLKNTFFEVAAHTEDTRPRREWSLPPLRQRPQMDEVAADQLARLNGVAGGGIIGISAIPTSVAVAVDIAGHSAEPLAASTPPGPAGFSVGSWGHAIGRCRPCSFVRSAGGCRSGAMCTFCHQEDGHPAPPAPRPCKGKRQRLRKILERLENRVAQDPEWLVSGNMKLPAGVEHYPQQREAVMSRLLLIAAEAFARIANSETAPHPASARPVATACGV